MPDLKESEVNFVIEEAGGKGAGRASPSPLLWSGAKHGYKPRPSRTLIRGGVQAPSQSSPCHPTPLPLFLLLTGESHIL